MQKLTYLIIVFYLIFFNCSKKPSSYVVENSGSVNLKISFPDKTSNMIKKQSAIYSIDEITVLLFHYEINIDNLVIQEDLKKVGNYGKLSLEVDPFPDYIIALIAWEWDDYYEEYIERYWGASQNFSIKAGEAKNIFITLSEW